MWGGWLSVCVCIGGWVRQKRIRTVNLLKGMRLNPPTARLCLVNLLTPSAQHAPSHLPAALYSFTAHPEESGPNVNVNIYRNSPQARKSTTAIQQRGIRLTDYPPITPLPTPTLLLFVSLLIFIPVSLVPLRLPVHHAATRDPLPPLRLPR